MPKIFEQKNNTAAFVLVFIAAISGALFGLISAVASDTQTPPLLFVTLATFFSLITSTLIGLFSNNNNLSALRLIFITDDNKTPSAKSNIKDFRKTTLLRAFAGFGFVLTMAGFYLLDNKIIAVLISETYPIFAILLSYFLLKNDFKKSALPYDWLLIGVSFLGLLALFPKEIYLLENNIGQFYGVILSLIGALLASYAAVLSPVMTIQLSKIQNKGNLRNSLASQFITSLLMFCGLFLASIIFYTTVDFINLLNYKVLLAALLFGFFVDFISTFLSRVGTSIATTHNIFLLWLLTPAISIILLWLFDYGEINTTIVLAFILILIPNILLNLDPQHTLPFKTTFSSAPNKKQQL